MTRAELGSCLCTPMSIRLPGLRLLSEVGNCNSALGLESFGQIDLCNTQSSVLTLQGDHTLTLHPPPSRPAPNVSAPSQQPRRRRRARAGRSRRLASTLVGVRAAATSVEAAPAMLWSCAHRC